MMGHPHVPKTDQESRRRWGQQDMRFWYDRAREIVYNRVWLRLYGRPKFSNGIYAFH